MRAQVGLRTDGAAPLLGRPRVAPTWRAPAAAHRASSSTRIDIGAPLGPFNGRLIWHPRGVRCSLGQPERLVGVLACIPAPAPRLTREVAARLTPTGDRNERTPVGDAHAGWRALRRQYVVLGSPVRGQEAAVPAWPP